MLKKINSAAAVLALALPVVVFPAHASETVKGAKKDLEAFKKEMSQKLDMSEKKLKELREKAAVKGDEVQTKTVKELETTKDQLKGELATAKVEAKTNWSKFKTKMARSIDELNAKIQKKLTD